MSVIFKNNTLFVDDEPVIHEGSAGFAEMQQLCWVQVGDKRVIKPVTTRVYAKDLVNLSEDIRVHGFRVATIHSYFNKCYGDELTEGGVKSGTKGGPSHFITASPTVMHKGVALVRRGDLIIANNGNSAPGAWQDSTPFAPSFEDKCVSSSIDPSKAIETIQIQIQLNPKNTTEQILPFQRALCVSTGAGDYYQQTSSVSAMDHLLTYQFAVNASEKYEIKECLNDPTGNIYSVDQGSGNITLTAVDMKVFNTVSANPSEISQPYAGSWIYLLKDNKIWREFQGAREVNLLSHAGKDIRPRDIPIARGFLINPSHAYAYIVSPVQLTWTQMSGLSAGQALDKPVFDVYPVEETPGLLPRDAAYQYPHAAVGVLLLKDPFGNAKQIADQIISLHDFHMDELKKYEDLYHSATLVGDVLDALKEKGDDYRKHIREDERLAHIEAFERACKAYENEINRLTDVLIQFLKQSELTHDFLDLNMPHHLEQAVQDEWRIGMALQQTPLGRECVAAYYQDDDSRLNRIMNALTATVISPGTKGFALNALEVVALPAASNQQLFKKMIDWVNTVFSGEIKANIVKMPLQQVYEEARKMMSPLKLTPHQFVVQISSEHRLITLENDSGPYPKTFHLTTRTSMSLSMVLVDEVQLNGKSVHHMARDFADNRLLHSVFVILSTANVINIIRQTKTMKMTWWEKFFLFTELSGGVLDMISSVVRIVELSVHDVQKIGKPMVISGIKEPLKVSMKISGVAGGLFALLELRRFSETIAAGETGLAVGYGMSIGSTAAFLLNFVPKEYVLRVFTASSLMLASFVFTVISMALIAYFYKNDWEQWLFDSPWGMSKTNALDYQQSFINLLKITPMLHVSAVSYQDKSLYQLIPPERFDQVIHGPIEGLIPQLLSRRDHRPALHQQFMKSAIEITLRIVPLLQVLVVGSLSKKEAFDILTEGKAVAGFRYERSHHQDQNSGYMTILIPAQTLPAPGESLVLNVKYLIPNDNEFITIESKSFEIAYDPKDYVFKTKTIRG